jgi:hypothetical protein
MDYGEAPHTILYRNDSGSNIFSANTAPSAPPDLFEQVDDDQVLLSWGKSTDSQTLQDALNYNFRLGVTSNGEEVVPAMADAASGFRRVVACGNAASLDAVTVSGLTPGTYYWSVQAIDQGFLGSAFAPVRSFTVGTIGTKEPLSREDPAPFHPNPAHEEITFELGYLKGNTEISISDVSGKCHLTRMISGQENKVDVSSLSPGIYILTLTNASFSTPCKLVVR